MSNEASKISLPDLISVDNKEIMINTENTIETIRRLLIVIEDLEQRITALE